MTWNKVRNDRRLEEVSKNDFTNKSEFFTFTKIQIRNWLQKFAIYEHGLKQIYKLSLFCHSTVFVVLIPCNCTRVFNNVY